MIYVTHDQTEAMTLADRIVVFSSGRVEQVGAPLDLYHRPIDLFVAGFIGSPRMNFLQAHVVNASSQEVAVRLSEGTVLTSWVDAAHLRPGDTVTVGIRPDDVTLGNSHENQLVVTLRHAEHTGDATVLYTNMGGVADPLVVRWPGSFSAERGTQLLLTANRTACHVFDSEGKALCRTCGSSMLETKPPG